MKKKLKLLFVLENYYPLFGGAETVFVNLCEGLAKKGHEVRVVVQKIPGTKNYEVKNKIKIYRVDSFSRYFYPFVAIPLVWKLAREADVIHTSTYTGAGPAWLAARLQRKPIVITMHEVLGKKWSLTLPWPSSWLHHFLEWIIVKLGYTKYICVSKNTQNDLLNYVKKQKTTVIYNGFDWKFWNPKKYSGNEIRRKLTLSDNYVVFFYGRPGFSKGLEFLIKAMPKIVDKIPDARLLALVTQDKQYQKRFKKIMKIVKDLKIEPLCNILPSTSAKELPNYVAAADVVVVPSLTEGFGYTTVESCAMNKPIVASNVGSIPEVIFGRYVLVEPKNPDAIAEGVLKVYNREWLTSKKKNFSWKKNIDEHLKIYQRLI
ncbi:MAG: glycosyltransferase family 4 protein [Candidatus Woesearchaeota archaeon]